MTCRELQRKTALQVGYGQIRLRREGDYAIVSVMIAEEYEVDVIKELYDGCFNHTVYPSGIMDAAVEAGRSRFMNALEGLRVELPNAQTNL